MLAINDQQLLKLEEAMLVAQRRNFARWFAGYDSIIGHSVPGQAVYISDEVAEEARQSGIDLENRLFAYATARILMPTMTGYQYVQVMDVVFAPMSDEDRLLAIMTIRAQSDG